VPGANHYSILLADPGASAVDREIVAATSA
jgi:hypothetical protein